MITLLSDALLIAAAVCSGVIAGLCFAFSSFLMRSFDRLGPQTAIRVMQSLNAEILRSTAMVAWFATAALGAVGTILADARTLPLIATILYVVGAVAITGLANVPRNEALDEVDPSSPEAGARWDRYRHEWVRWNSLRTVMMVAASATFSAGLISM